MIEKKVKWAKKAFKPENKGLLHKHLGVPEGKPIPSKKMKEALNSKDETVRKEAQAAVNINKKHKSAKEIIHSMYQKKGK